MSCLVLSCLVFWLSLSCLVFWSCLVLVLVLFLFLVLSLSCLVLSCPFLSCHVGCLVSSCLALVFVEALCLLSWVFVCLCLCPCLCQSLGYGLGVWLGYGFQIAFCDCLGLSCGCLGCPHSNPNSNPNPNPNSNPNTPTLAWLANVALDSSQQRLLSVANLGSTGPLHLSKDLRENCICPSRVYSIWSNSPKIWLRPFDGQTHLSAIVVDSRGRGKPMR